VLALLYLTRKEMRRGAHKYRHVDAMGALGVGQCKRRELRPPRCFHIWWRRGGVEQDNLGLAYLCIAPHHGLSWAR